MGGKGQSLLTENPINKCERNDRIWKSPFSKHHRDNCYSQERWLDAKVSEQKNDEKWNICIVSKNLPRRVLIKDKGKKSNFRMKKPYGHHLHQVTTVNIISNETHWLQVSPDALKKAMGGIPEKKSCITAT